MPRIVEHHTGFAHWEPLELFHTKGYSCASSLTQVGSLDMLMGPHEQKEITYLAVDLKTICMRLKGS